MGTWIDGQRVGSALTTPEAPDLHALFAVMRERGVGICAIEVSSHALVMGRVDGVVFDLAVFTNLGRDHLDFHADMEDYFAAKAQLFTPARASEGLGQHRRRVRRSGSPPSRRSRSRRCRVSRQGGGPGTPRWTSSALIPGRRRSTSYGRTGRDRCQTAVPMPGEFNVANGLAAFAACVEAGIEPADAVEGLGLATPVGGRMERIAADERCQSDHRLRPQARRPGGCA